MMRRPPKFGDSFRKQLEELIRWRRDVRSFRSDPVGADLLEHLIALACLAPSVGYSQPWQFVQVDSARCRALIQANFEESNKAALKSYCGGKAQLYATLKLAGLQEAPVQLAIFLTSNTTRGSGLGRFTMPDTLEYSAVLAVHTLWLAARSFELGLGWISILDPMRVNRDLSIPDDWKLVAYLCIGYPREDNFSPELLRRGWEAPVPLQQVLVRR
jgi:5,6-dimethylbenzimidazole synthase